jgi:hypothetical protein
MSALLTSWLGLPVLAVAFAVAPFSFWVFTTAAKGWPAR